MEKLIELLNEYEDLSDAEECEKWCIDEYDRISEGGRRSQGTNNWICSKNFGFIKWLVNNDKIDLDMVREKLGIPCCVWYGSGRIIAVKDVEDYKQVLMLLSISDTPIDDLISYLK